VQIAQQLDDDVGLSARAPLERVLELDDDVGH
jgi:hypothetical protein